MYKATNWFLWALESNARYLYLDQNFVTDREAQARFSTSHFPDLRAQLGCRIEQSIQPLRPLHLYAYFLEPKLRRATLFRIREFSKVRKASISKTEPIKHYLFFDKLSYKVVRGDICRLDVELHRGSSASPQMPQLVSNSAGMSVSAPSVRQYAPGETADFLLTFNSSSDERLMSASVRIWSDQVQTVQSPEYDLIFDVRNRLWPYVITVFAWLLGIYLIAFGPDYAVPIFTYVAHTHAKWINDHSFLLANACKLLGLFLLAVGSYFGSRMPKLI